MLKVKDELYLYDLEGNQIERLAPEHVGTFSISASREHDWFFATMSGFTTPATIGHYDLNAQDEDQRWNVYRKTVLKGLNTEDFSAEQVWYDSKDGTRIPMFIVRHKSTPKDGTAPAIQYGTIIDLLQEMKLIRRAFRIWRLRHFNRPIFQHELHDTSPALPCHTCSPEHSWGRGVWRKVASSRNEGTKGDPFLVAWLTKQTYVFNLKTNVFEDFISAS